jgi:cyclophilin family peptidyl-prolyl cis-trans isomerase
LKKTASLLDPEVRGFFDQFSWENPPRIEARLSVTLPPWTNSSPYERREIFRTAALDGEYTVFGQVISVMSVVQQTKQNDLIKRVSLKAGTPPAK